MFDLFIYCLYQPYKHFIFKQEFKKDIFVRIFKFSNFQIFKFGVTYFKQFK